MLLFDFVVSVCGFSVGLVEMLESVGLFGMGWLGLCVVVGLVWLVKVDFVGIVYVCLIVCGEDGVSFKVIVFCVVESDMG